MTDKPTVVEALAAVMEDVRGVSKRDKHASPGANFMFRGIDAVVNAVGPQLRKHHVVVTPRLVSVDRRDVTTSGGKPSRETCVVVAYVFTGPDGSTIEATVPGEAMDNGDKGTAKAMSVAFRTALLQALCLPTDEPDPDATAYERDVPAPPSPVELAAQARGRLAATCTENGWDRGRVAARFADQHDGRPLGECHDAAVIERFRKSLFNVSDAELKAATNGAQA